MGSNGNAVFSAGSFDLGAESSHQAGVADLDDDGDLDVVLAHGNVGSSIWLQDQNANFVASGTLDDRTFGLAIADFDGDGDPDIYAARYGNGGQNNPGPDRVYLNDGSGSFTFAGQDIGNGMGVRPVAGDLDCDDDLDVVVANGWGPGDANMVLINDGTGSFTATGQTLGTTATHGLSLGDLDGNGTLDVFAANTADGPPVGAANRVWLNDGTGTFVWTGQVMPVSASEWAALGDVDGDGDLDAVVANYQHDTRVWTNDGTGIFTDSGQTMSGSTTAARLADFDVDGDLDLYLTNTAGEPDRLYLNDGAGSFSNSGQSLGSGFSFLPAVADLDGNGSLDVIVPVSNNLSHSVWLNGI